MARRSLETLHSRAAGAFTAKLGGYKAHSIGSCRLMVRLNSISLSEYAEFFHRLWPGAGLPARLGKSQLSLGTFFTLALG